ncbi:hypothetical protein Aspvir_001164 [Aspergillus viridinutans]|uniref:Uncharacterized protein n=1 Tax=Aspergillus viridinutans TaxID=75553 RepID=A0A9P3BS76_ASPVI|nr:uncharacterized protein Aspvir_001164 [Aspergillus viridinutans]GIJ99040.1 hypothetical protein Aspvir_001164 [Aspergillus viridinutans]
MTTPTPTPPTPQEASTKPPPPGVSSTSAAPPNIPSPSSKQAAKRTWFPNPPDRRWCSDNTYLEDKHDIVHILEEGFLTLPSADSYAFWCPMTPTRKRKPPDMAFSMQSDHYFAVYAGWKNEADDERRQSWLQLVMDKIRSHGVGTYIGESDFSVRPDLYWAEDNESRLKEIRRRWDPYGRFCGFP